MQTFTRGYPPSVDHWLPNQTYLTNLPIINYGVPMVFLWFSYGFPGVTSTNHGISLGHLPSVTSPW